MIPQALCSHRVCVALGVLLVDRVAGTLLWGFHRGGWIWISGPGHFPKRAAPGVWWADVPRCHYERVKCHVRKRNI